MAVRRGLSDDQPVHDLHVAFLLAAVFLFDCEVFIMCEVKRYKAMVNTPDSVIVADVYLSEDFDRVQAVNQKLQARLTVQDQRVDELEALLEEFATEMTLAITDSQVRSAMTSIGRTRFLQLLQANNARIDSALNPTAEAASHVDCGSCRNITDGCKGKCQRAEEWSKP